MLQIGHMTILSPLLQTSFLGETYNRSLLMTTLLILWDQVKDIDLAHAGMSVTISQIPNKDKRKPTTAAGSNHPV